MASPRRRAKRRRLLSTNAAGGGGVAAPPGGPGRCAPAPVGLPQPPLRLEHVLRSVDRSAAPQTVRCYHVATCGDVAAAVACPRGRDVQLRSVEVWRLSDGSLRQRLAFTGEHALCLAVGGSRHADTVLVAMGDGRSTLRVWLVPLGTVATPRRLGDTDVASSCGRPIGTILQPAHPDPSGGPDPAPQPINRVAVVPLGAAGAAGVEGLVVGGADECCTVRVWSVVCNADAAHGVCRRSRGHTTHQAEALSLQLTQEVDVEPWPVTMFIAHPSLPVLLVCQNDDLVLVHATNVEVYAPMAVEGVQDVVALALAPSSSLYGGDTGEGHRHSPISSSDSLRETVALLAWACWAVVTVVNGGGDRQFLLQTHDWGGRGRDVEALAFSSRHSYLAAVLTVDGDWRDHALVGVWELGSGTLCWKWSPSRVHSVPRIAWHPRLDSLLAVSTAPDMHSRGTDGPAVHLYHVTDTSKASDNSAQQATRAAWATTEPAHLRSCKRCRRDAVSWVGFAVEDETRPSHARASGATPPPGGPGRSLAATAAARRLNVSPGMAPPQPPPVFLLATCRVGARLGVWRVNGGADTRGAGGTGSDGSRGTTVRKLESSAGPRRHHHHQHDTPRRRIGAGRKSSRDAGTSGYGRLPRALRARVGLRVALMLRVGVNTAVAAVVAPFVRTSWHARRRCAEAAAVADAAGRRRSKRLGGLRLPSK